MAAGQGGRAATSVWQLFQAQRRAAASLAGATMPSSRNLYDIVKRDLLERHNAAQVTDIWMEASSRAGGRGGGGRRATLLTLTHPPTHPSSTPTRSSTAWPRCYRRAPTLNGWSTRRAGDCSAGVLGGGGAVAPLDASHTPPTHPHTLAPSPMFVLPVFKGPNAFENFMVQCQPPLVRVGAGSRNAARRARVTRGGLARSDSAMAALQPTRQVLVTSLEEYKRHGSGAAPQVALTHYTELAEEKGVVLVRADVIQPNAVSQGEVRGGPFDTPSSSSFLETPPTIRACH